MSTRFSLGRGWTIGASGLRYGRKIPGVPRGWVSTGSSGTLVTGAGVRHWSGSGRGRAGGGAPARGPGAASHARRSHRRMVWTGVAGMLLLAAVVGLIVAAYAQQAAFRRADIREGLAAARVAGAPGICLNDNPDQIGGTGHYGWVLARGGVPGGECDPTLETHFVAVRP